MLNSIRYLINALKSTFYTQIAVFINMLEIKQTKAYQIIQKLNKELKDQRKLVVAGRVSKKYFDERMY